jgi:hypothetical protein
VKTFIAYTLLVIGIPALAGMVIGTILTVPIMRLLHAKTSISTTNLMLYLETVNGFVAAVVGALLFRLFGLTPGPAVPLTIAAWITYYFFSYHQPKRAWVSWLLGIFVGWFTVGQAVALT